MTVRRRATALALAVVASVTAALMATPPVPRSAVAIAGIIAECNLVSLQLTRTGTTYDLTTGGGTVCVFSGDFSGTATDGRIVIRSTGIPSANVRCSGNGSVEGFDAPVTVTLSRTNGSMIDSYPDVRMIVDGLAGTGTVNPTAMVTVSGLSIAGAGSFTRSGSGACNGSTSWTLGNLVFRGP